MEKKSISSVIIETKSKAKKVANYKKQKKKARIEREKRIFEERRLIQEQKDPDFEPNESTDTDHEEEHEEKIIKKRHTSKILLDKASNLTEPKEKFGRPIRFNYSGFIIPYSYNRKISDEEDIKNFQEIQDQLKRDSILSTIIFTLLRKAFNTSNGKVGLFFANIYNSTGSYPVVVGHWSLWQRICMHLYSSFSPRSSDAFGVRKCDFKSSFANIIGKNFHADDINKLRIVTGADPMTPSRVINDSHFVISAYWLQYASLALSQVEVIEELIHDHPSDDAINVFCTDDTLTVQGLGDYKTFDVSAFLLIRTQQSKFSAMAHFGNRSFEVNSVFDDLTPSFGVPWSKDQLIQLSSVMEFFMEKKSVQIGHFESFYKTNNDPLRSRHQIMESLPNGVLDDSKLRHTTNHNYASKIDQKKVREFLENNGIEPPGRGRTSKGRKFKATLKRTLIEREEKLRGKRTKTDKSPNISVEELLKKAKEDEQKSLINNRYTDMTLLDNIFNKIT